MFKPMPMKSNEDMFAQTNQKGLVRDSEFHKSNNVLSLLIGIHWLARTVNTFDSFQLIP